MQDLGYQLFIGNRILSRNIKLCGLSPTPFPLCEHFSYLVTIIFFLMEQWDFIQKESQEKDELIMRVWLPKVDSLSLSQEKHL